VNAAADALRRAGQRYLGRELDRARFAHWTGQWYPGWIVADRQREKLAAIVAHARARSRFYRERLAGLPEELDLGAYARVPFLTREEVLFHAAAIRCGGGWASRSSGGSSGTGVRIPVDAEAYAWYLAGTWLGLRWSGTDFTQRGAVLLGPRPGGLVGVASRVKDWVMNWIRIPVEPGFDGRATRVVERLRTLEPAYLYAYPSAAQRLARAVLEGRAAAPSGLKVVVFTGEPVYSFQRREVEEAFGCPVAVEYGSGEVGCVAFTCPAGTPHLMAENVYVEVAEDPRLPAGGWILVTQLHNRLFPLLRYRIGDVGLVREPTCPCGRALPELQVLGRGWDLLVADGEARFVHPLLDRLFEQLPDRLLGRVRLRHPAPGEATVEVDSHTDADVSRVRDLTADLLGPGWRVRAARAMFRRLPSGKCAYFVADGTGTVPDE